MKEHNPIDLSKAEWKVMKIMWEEQKAMAREVYTVAGKAFGWSPTTVKTLLKRLVDKGYLSATPIGNGFVYRPIHSAVQSLRSAADHLLSNAIEGATGPLIVHMVENSNLKQSDLDLLEELIKSKKAEINKAPRRTKKARSKES